MKRRTLAIWTLLIGGAIVFLILVTVKEEKVRVLDFEWTIHSATAPFSFRIENRTDAPIGVVVIVKAENISEGDDGVKLFGIGLSKLHIQLEPGEKRTVSGTVELTRNGSSATVLSCTAALTDLGDANR